MDVVADVLGKFATWGRVGDFDIKSCFLGWPISHVL